MPIVTLQLTTDAAEYAQKFRASPKLVLGAIREGLDLANVEAVSHIKETKLTAAGPQFLNVRSGRLRRSVRASAATIRGNVVQSSIGSNVKYAAAHEYGAVAHKIVAKGKALRFKPVGVGVFKRNKGFIFRKSVTIPALPARRPFATGIAEKVADGTYTGLISGKVLSIFGP